MTIAEWRGNEERCAEFAVMLAHPMMRDFEAMIREMVLPQVGPEIQVPQAPVTGDAIRDYAMRHMYMAGQASVIKLMGLLRTHEPLFVQKEPPPEWLPDVEDQK